MAHTPPFATLVALAFLAFGAAVALTALALLAAAAFRKTRLIPWIAGIGAFIVLGYAGVLLADSALSRQRVLLPGEKKYFCELDCHLAYSVEAVEITPTLGPALEPLRASGRWRLVHLRTWFDPSTIAPWRGDAPLQPNPRTVYVRDAAGRRYEPSPEGERALEAAGRASAPLTRPLRPGESYETLLPFDLPDSAPEPRLYVGDGDPLSFLLIGHEESPLHPKIWFRI